MPEMMLATIRAATMADLDAVLTLYHEFHAFHARGVPAWLRIPAEYDDATAREHLTMLLLDEDTALFVAEADGVEADGVEAGGVLIGLAEVYLRRDTPHPSTIAYTYAHLQSLVVTEARRGHGVGTRLVTAARAWARDHGATQLRLSTWEFPGGPLPFYEALGFTTLKRTLVAELG